jgi:two-component system OmpR family sensor kinase
LVAALMVVTVVGFVIFGAISTLVLERLQEVRLDGQLDVIATDISGTSQPPPKSLPEADQAPSEFRLMYFDGDGRPMIRLGAPVGKSTYPHLPDMNTEAVRTRGPKPFTAPDEKSDVRWRVRTFVRTGAAAENSSETAAVAISMETVDGTVAWLRSIELIAGAILLLVMTMVAIVVVRIGLRPLTSIEIAATSIADGDLERRVSVDGHTEVTRLGEAFNTMLDRLADVMQQLAGSEQRMRTFIADASHDLRTPLTAIRGYAELYRHGPGDEATRREIVARIETAAQRMGRLVDDLVELAEYDERPALRTVDVDIAQLVRDTADEARSGAPTRDVTVTGAETPVIVRGDDRALRRVFGNLIGNALVHTNGSVRIVIAEPHRSPDERAALPARAVAGAAGSAEDGVNVYVIDDGPGIPPEKSAHVFERFYQADESRERGVGSGLGLSIVAAILTAHRGRVELLDTDRGATFRVTLPLG